MGFSDAEKDESGCSLLKSVVSCAFGKKEALKC